MLAIAGGSIGYLCLIEGISVVKAVNVGHGVESSGAADVLGEGIGGQFDASAVEVGGGQGSG